MKRRALLSNALLLLLAAILAAICVCSVADEQRRHDQTQQLNHDRE